MPQWRFRYFSQKDGLSNTFINCWAQDSIGYVWLGTQNGLNRFNGTGFKSYAASSSDTTLLPNINVTHLLTDLNGKLWIVTKRGICTYNRQKDAFDQVQIEGYDGSVNFEASHINMDGNGIVHISAGNKLYRYLQSEHRMSLFATLPDGDISCFIFDQQNGIWVGLSEGGKLIWFNSQMNRRRIVSVALRDAKEYCPATGLVWYQNELWVGMLHAGIFSVNTTNLKVTEHLVGLPNSETPLFLYKDKKNKLWSIDYTGLKFYDRPSSSYLGVYPNNQDPYSIKSNVSGFFEDNQGNYWVIHLKGGVAIHVKDKGFSRITNNTYDYWKLTNSGVVAIAEDRQGSLWLAQDPPFIDVFNYSKGYMERFSSGPRINDFDGGTIRCIYTDQKGNVWLATYNTGLQLFDGKSRRFSVYKHDPGNLNSLPHNDIIGIDEDDRGNLWLALHGGGVAYFDLATKRFKHFNVERNNLSNLWTNHVLCDSKGRVWVAAAWGLSLLEKNSDKFKIFFSTANDTTTLCSSNVFTTYEDAEGRIWVGTDQGLNLYNETTGHFKRIDKGLVNNSICAILDDSLGYLWVSTLSGISRIDKKTIQIFNFGEDDGIQGDEFYPNSSLKSSNGMLYFGGVKGATSITPANVRFNSYLPPVIISSLTVDNKEMTGFMAKNTTIDKDYSNAGLVNLAHDHRMMVVRFLGLSFNNPGRQNYKVKLVGIDNEWQELGTKNEVVFSQLSPGKYKLMLMASNNDGLWNPVPTTLTIVVSPPWYGTLLFKTILFFSIIAMFWIIVWIRTKQLHLQRHQLAIMVNDKTQELQSYNQELLAQAEYLDSVNKLLAEKQEKVESQARILAVQTEALRKSNRDLKQLNQTKDRLFSIIAHDLLNPFTSIMGLSEISKENYELMDDNERKDLASAIHLSSSRLFNLLQNLLLWARSQTSSIKFDRQTFPVKEILEEATEHFHEQLNQKEINFHIACPPSLCAYADVDMAKTIVRNLVNNAIKFTPRQGSIGIIANTEANFAVISVMDTGTGMKEEDARTLFDTMVVHSTKGTDGETGTGLGLLICKEFVERNGGEISVESIWGAGSTFKVKLPLTAW